MTQNQAKLARARSPPKANFAQVCHERYNHTSIAKGSPLYKVLSQEFGKKFTDAPGFTCYACLFSKTHQLPHPRLSDKQRTEKNGDGPFAECFLDTVSYPYPGESGERYMALLSNTGRNIACLCSKRKSETPGLVVKQLKQWMLQYGNIDILNCTDFSWMFLPPQDGEMGKKASVTKLTYDGAAEFMGKELTSYLDDKGIMHRATCRHTPQQNAAENIVKIVTQGTETLLWQSGLPRIYWCRAARYFCKIYELLPNSAHRGDFSTPYEALIQKKVPFKHLHHFTFAFGEECFYHEPRELREHTHGCEKSLRAIFLGFSAKKKGYTILTERDGKVIEGVWDIFFTGEFPLRRELTRRNMLSFTKQLQQKNAQILRKFGPPTLQDDPPARSEGWGDGEQGSAIGSDYSQDEAEPQALESIPNIGNFSAPIEAAPTDEISLQGQRDYFAQFDQNDTNEQADVRNDDALFTQLCEQIYSGETMTPEHADISVSNTFTEDDGIAPSSPARLQLNQRVQCDGEECLVQRIHSDGDVELTWPNSSEPDRRYTVDKSEIVASPLTDTSTMPSLESTPEEGKYDQDTTGSALRLKYQIGKAMGAKDITTMSKPTHWKQIAARKDAAKWITAQKEHIKKIKDMKVFEVVTRKSVAKLGHKYRVLNATWAFDEKERAHSKGLKEASARVAAGGYGQEQYVDYNETYAPTMSMTAYKANEADAANDSSIIRECWDISGAYYRSIPKYRQYMKEPPGFETGPDNIWHLLRCMPGTKDAGHCYNVQLTDHLVEKVGFEVNNADHASFRLVDPQGDFINLNIHVDDTAAFGSSQKLMDDVFELINSRFPMKRRKGIGLMVGIESERDQDGIHLRQISLIKDIVKMAGLEGAKAVSTPCHGLFKGFTPADLTLDPEKRKIFDVFPYRQLVGKIAYVARNTRIDIAWITCELQRYGTNYTQAQIDALTHLIKYLNATKEVFLTFRSDFKHPIKLFFAVDAGYGSSLINRASHEGLVAFYKGCPIVHVSKRQKVIALSSMESEFMAATEAAKMSKWLYRLLDGFDMGVAKPVPLFEDNQATIYLSKHPSLNGSRSRHMEIRWHWLQQAVADGEVELVYIPTAGQLADILTKPTPKHVHDALVPAIMGQQSAYTPVVLQVLQGLMSDRKKQGKAMACRNTSFRPTPETLFHHWQSTPNARKPARHRAATEDTIPALSARLIKMLFLAIICVVTKIGKRILKTGCGLLENLQPQQPVRTKRARHPRRPKQAARRINRAQPAKRAAPRPGI